MLYNVINCVSRLQFSLSCSQLCLQYLAQCSVYRRRSGRVAWGPSQYSLHLDGQLGTYVPSSALSLDRKSRKSFNHFAISCMSRAYDTTNVLFQLITVNPLHLANWRSRFKTDSVCTWEPSKNASLSTPGVQRPNTSYKNENYLLDKACINRYLQSQRITPST